MSFQKGARFPPSGEVLDNRTAGSLSFGPLQLTSMVMADQHTCLVIGRHHHSCVLVDWTNIIHTSASAMQPPYNDLSTLMR